MPAPKNVLLIVVDQWRGLMLPKLGADYLKVPNIHRLSEEGVTFRNHFTQTAPCGPARASLLAIANPIRPVPIQPTDGSVLECSAEPAIVCPLPSMQSIVGLELYATTGRGQAAISSTAAGDG